MRSTETTLEVNNGIIVVQDIVEKVFSILCSLVPSYAAAATMFKSQIFKLDCFFASRSYSFDSSQFMFVKQYIIL